MKSMLSALYALLLVSAAAHAQFSLPSIPDLPVDIPTLSDIPFVEDLLEKDPVITTALEDAVFECPDMDGFDPEFFTPLYEMPVDSDGMIYLLPGAYELEARSYCLHAGTYAPESRGNGYIYAPLEGSGSDIILSILNRSCDHGEIPQTDVQELIWAVLARCDFSEMNSRMQRTAAALLTPQEIFELNGGAMALIPDDMMDSVFGELPGPVRAVMEAEAEIRNTMSQAEYSYEELEEIAILRGNPPDHSNVRDIPSGRWSLHPDGYYIRFFPSGYEHTRVEIWVPVNTSTDLSCKTDLTKARGRRGNIPKWTGPPLQQYDWSKHKVVKYEFNGWTTTPGSTGRQRLLVAPRKSSSQTDREIDKIKNSVGLFSTVTSIPTDPLGVVNLGSGWGVGKFLDKNIDIWGTSIKALGADPPRSDYTLYAIPVIIHIDSLVPGGDLSPQRAAALNSFAKASMELIAVMEAAQISLDRMGGACDASDEHWASEQAVCYVFYKGLAGELLEITAERLENLIDVSRSEGLQDTYITTAMASAYQNNLRANGFSAEEIDQAHYLGMTDGQIQETIQTRLSFTPQELEGSLFEAADKCIEYMYERGIKWQLLPEIYPYWTENVEYPQYTQ